ncbi:MAG: hypothetical protein II748_00690 [Clostridia bacterium]|nr:hypothetical protein [Clostridia bacterium]
MSQTNGFFTADYRDGRVYFDGKNYPAGIFATHLLNQFYVNDTAARLSVFCDNVHYNILRQLRCGYLTIWEFEKTGENLLELIKTLPDLRPFDTLDITALKEKITVLFTEETGERICEYFRMRGQLSALDQSDVASGSVKKHFDEKLNAEGEQLISEITRIISFFDNLSDDLITAHENLTEFIKRLPEAERFDEKHLLPIALETFGSAPFSVTSEYITVAKNKASPGEAVARRMYFDSYYAFILTDFFEGLHYGHYPQRCGICGKYFLMQSARKQMYCSYGIAPEEYRGKPITCRKYAAVIHRKERAEGDPITNLYDKRCAAIRSEKSRGTITDDFAKAAKALALEHKQRAHNDDNYAKKQYKADMERDKLYADADIFMK